jgi:hypothetical protein
VLQQLTKRLSESALAGEIADHLGDDKHDRLAVGPATCATALVPRPCSPTWVWWKSTYPATGMPASSPPSSPSGRNIHARDGYITRSRISSSEPVAMTTRTELTRARDHRVVILLDGRGRLVCLPFAQLAIRLASSVGRTPRNQVVNLLA